MNRIIVACAALGLITGAAAAGASASTATNASVVFYSGFPGSGGTALAHISAQAATQASVRQSVKNADSAVVTVGSHSYTFATAPGGGPALTVKGAAGARTRGEASVRTVVDDLGKAEQGDEGLAVVSRSQGGGQVVVALYHPQSGNVGLRVHNADHVTVWVNGQAHDYAVSGNIAGATVTGLQVAAHGNGHEALTNVIANLQTHAALSGSSKNGSSSGGSGSSAGASAGGSANLNVNVGGSH